MPVLPNARHERFAQELAKGKTQEAAYIAAGYAPASAEQNASRLISNDKVAARVAELKERAAEKVEWNIADAVRELEEARLTAKLADTPQTSAMVAATMGKAKLLGLVVEQHKDVTPADEQRDALARRLARLAAGTGKAGLSSEPVA